MCVSVRVSVCACARACVSECDRAAPLNLSGGRVHFSAEEAGAGQLETAALRVLITAAAEREISISQEFGYKNKIQRLA